MFYFARVCAVGDHLCVCHVADLRLTPTSQRHILLNYIFACRVADLRLTPTLQRDNLRRSTSLSPATLPTSSSSSTDRAVTWRPAAPTATHPSSWLQISESDPDFSQMGSRGWEGGGGWGRGWKGKDIGNEGDGKGEVYWQGRGWEGKGMGGEGYWQGRGWEGKGIGRERGWEGVGEGHV